MDQPHDATYVKPLHRRRENPWIRRALVFVTVVLLVDALFGENGLAASLRARRQYDDAAARLASIRQGNSELRERARNLRYDASTIEDEARRQLGVVRPGEILFLIRNSVAR